MKEELDLTPFFVIAVNSLSASRRAILNEWDSNKKILIDILEKSPHVNSPFLIIDDAESVINNFKALAVIEKYKKEDKIDEVVEKFFKKDLTFRKAFDYMYEVAEKEESFDFARLMDILTASIKKVFPLMAIFTIVYNLLLVNKISIKEDEFNRNYVADINNFVSFMLASEEVQHARCEENDLSHFRESVSKFQYKTPYLQIYSFLERSIPEINDILQTLEDVHLLDVEMLISELINYQSVVRSAIVAEKVFEKYRQTPSLETGAKEDSLIFGLSIFFDALFSSIKNTFQSISTFVLEILKKELIEEDVRKTEEAKKVLEIKLADADALCRNLTLENLKLKKELEQMKEKLSQIEKTEKELYALRDYVFSNMQEELSQVQTKKDVIESLKDKKGVFIGGSENIIRNYKEKLPLFTFVDGSKRKFDAMILENAEVMIIYPKILNHMLYYYSIEQAKERNIKIIFI